MHITTTTKPRPRARTVRGLAVAGATGLLLASLPSGVAAAHGGGDWGGNVLTVGHGQQFDTIQKAVDAASSGDTIWIAPGEYVEAVCIDGKGLTIEGAGRGDTTITWPAPGTPEAAVEPASTACWRATNAADLEDDDAILADNVSALFFLNPDKPVSVSGLKTKNHPANGIAAWGADGFSVHDTKGVGHDRYGILAAASHDIDIRGNVEIGIDRSDTNGDGLSDGVPNSGTAGISIGDSADSNAKVAWNYVEGYNLGIFLREASGGAVEGNHLTGNCVGLLGFDDTATEIPNTQGNVDAGHWWISGNESVANNRFCLQGREGDQRISGVGMALVNLEDVSVKGNSIRDNRPTTPPPPGVVVPPGAPTFTFPSAGLSLISLTPFVPGPGVPGLITDVRVVGNDFGANQAVVPTGPPPAPEIRLEMDIFLSSATPGTPLLAVGPGLVFEGNSCDASVPPTICGQPYPVQ
jgi:hypothetical protein